VHHLAQDGQIGLATPAAEFVLITLAHGFVIGKAHDRLRLRRVEADQIVSGVVTPGLGEKLFRHTGQLVRRKAEPGLVVAQIAGKVLAQPGEAVLQLAHLLAPGLGQVDAGAFEFFQRLAAGFDVDLIAGLECLEALIQRPALASLVEQRHQLQLAGLGCLAHCGIGADFRQQAHRAGQVLHLDVQPVPRLQGILQRYLWQWQFFQRGNLLAGAAQGGITLHRQFGRTEQGNGAGRGGHGGHGRPDGSQQNGNGQQTAFHGLTLFGSGLGGQVDIEILEMRHVIRMRLVTADPRLCQRGANAVAVVNPRCISGHNAAHLP
jgi:hypothetical protein